MKETSNSGKKLDYYESKGHDEWLRFIYKVRPHLSYLQELKRRNQVLSRMSNGFAIESEMKRRKDMVTRSEKNWSAIRFFLNPINLYNYIRMCMGFGKLWKEERRHSKTINEEETLRKAREMEMESLREWKLPDE